MVSGLFARALVWGLGHLIRGGSSWGMDDDVGILRTPFCSFVVLDEDGVGLGECLQLGVCPCVVLSHSLSRALSLHLLSHPSFPLSILSPSLCPLYISLRASRCSRGDRIPLSERRESEPMTALPEEACLSSGSFHAACLKRMYLQGTSRRGAQVTLYIPQGKWSILKPKRLI